MENHIPQSEYPDKKRPKALRDISIRAFNGWMITIACILFALLLSFIIHMIVRYNAMIKASDDYIAAESDAAMLHSASDYLTEEVRLFAINMDLKHINNYFHEVNITKRREHALEELQNHSVDDDTKHSLENALKNSNKLIQQEIYSMKLIAVANNYKKGDLPEEVQSVTLTADDAALTPEEQIKKGQLMVFDQSYQDTKQHITTQLDTFTDRILSTMRYRQEKCINSLHLSIILVIIFVSLLFIMNMITFLVITLLVVHPLKVYIHCIEDKKLFEVTGASEFKYMAVTYNNIYELNSANEAMLRYKAEHDPLTGILNRESFFQLQAMMKNSSHPIALLLADVDEFKQINDIYGHEMGDEVLKKVAHSLKTTFRSSDYCIRIGGDEFAMLLMDMQLSDQDLIRRKVTYLNDMLKNPDDNLPPTSLSIGVAFSEHGYRDDLYKQADSVLYKVKEHGRCGCAFYHPYKIESYIKQENL